MAQLLVVDDETAICWGLSELGRGLGHEVSCAASAEQGLELAAAQRPDAIFLDVRLPGRDGLSAMPDYQRVASGAPIIVMTAFGDLATAARAVQQRAFDYLVKPFRIEQVERVLARALATGDAPAETLPRLPVPADGLVGRSPVMQEVFKRTAVAAASEGCVLIQGASGTGKELLARAIHRYSPRRHKPFVPVNLAALSPALIESELFGHQAGAFTGAIAAREGLLRRAHGGTLFLDEVGEVPPAVQVKLLRVLEYGEYYAVGADRAAHVDLRIVAATHRNLAQRVSAGEFRQDFYFRLTTFPLHVPPLCERDGDAALLARHFLEQFAERMGRNPPTLSAAALVEIERRPWHGNVRELAHAMQYALAMAPAGTIDPEHLPASLPPLEGAAGADPQAALREAVRHWTRQAAVEPSPPDIGLHAQLRDLIEAPLFAEVLQRHGGQLAPAARTLGVHRMTLRKRLKELGLRGDVEDGDAGE